jgi:hypothetical protein
MVGAIVALMAISLFVLSDVPSDSEDSTDQAMTYLSLLLFMMAVALIGALAVVVSRKGGEDPDVEEVLDQVDDDIGDDASDIELEFRALEKEIDMEERS